MKRPPADFKSFYKWSAAAASYDIRRSVPYPTKFMCCVKYFSGLNVISDIFYAEEIPHQEESEEYQTKYDL